jgi:hypothetical protein
MESSDDLISTKGDYVLASPGKSYVVLLKNGGESNLDFGNTDSNYEVMWYNPRIGGDLQKGSVKTIKGSGKQSLGTPPNEKNKDWVVWIQKI